MTNKDLINKDIEGELAWRRNNRMLSYFPDTGPLARGRYAKHVDFFAAGAAYRERAFVAGNRVGKTIVGGYETTCHLTGRYPEWWEGKRFNRPVPIWAAGDTSKTVKEILQSTLLGPPGELGTGLIPADAISKTTSRTGLADAVETVWVKHKSGGHSTLIFKSYDQRREAFQGTAQGFIWLDEECPLDIYAECLIRTMTTNGSIMLTFTPLSGLTDVVLQFLPGGTNPESQGSRFVMMAGWDDVPHLTEASKAELMAAIPAYQRAARRTGTPQLGAGAIYPVPESDFVVPDFAIPDHWPRCYGLDVGWNRTAVIWGARNLDTDELYLYSEHYRGEGEPPVHVEAIRARGAWVKGVIDPAARGRGQGDGLQLMQRYIDLGLDIEAADNGVESGLMAVYSRLIAGKLKVFGSLQNWLAEYRLYRRDTNGRVHKASDHLMDATRYMVVSGLERSVTKPVVKLPKLVHMSVDSARGGWMG